MAKSDDRSTAAAKLRDDALRLHAAFRGKIQTLPKCPVRDLGDFSIWYTPGVAAPCLEIHKTPERVYDYTNKGNSVAVISDGTRVLGLGDIGPEAGLPVMEGKALLFKYLGGVDAVPICLGSRDPEDIIRTVKLLEPSFGGVNLEDIAQPKCFKILARLRAEMTIPVWHDDQQGSAAVVLAGLINALAVVGKQLSDIRLALIGMGAANVATYRLLTAAGVAPTSIVACDSKGTLHRKRADLEELARDFPEKWRVATETNPDTVAGGIAEALRGADVCIAFTRSGPGIIRAEWLKAMAKDAILFACANPVPEIWPADAKQAGVRIAATGRSDFPNQVNNSLCFPGIFRGVLDIRARTITDSMAIAAAEALARLAAERGLGDERILPPMDDPEVAARVAVATALRAQQDGVAALSAGADELHERASAKIDAARRATRTLMDAGLIAAMPER